MSQLLKNVWRNALKSSSINLLKMRSLSSSLAELPQLKTSDVIMTRIKSASCTSDVLAAVQMHINKMTHKHMLQALRSLFELQRAGRYYGEEGKNLVKDPTFSVLCLNFKKHARALDVNEAIEATKVLSYLRVPVDSLILQTMLQMIRCNINTLNIRQIMFLDFILSRFDCNNHLVDALKLALPLAFQIHLAIEIDDQDVSLLRDVLAYSCMHDLPERTINSIVTCLLLHDQAITPQIAKSIIWSLCQINCTREVYPTRVNLLHICCNILKSELNQLSYDDVLRTAARLKGRILEKHPEYYHEELMDGVADYVVDKRVEFEKSLLVARILSRIAHTHLRLSQYLCDLATSKTETLKNARTNILFGFVNCLSNSNYVPDPAQSLEIFRQISENPILDAKHAALPWTKFALELASIGHYEDRLLRNIFSEGFLNDYLNRENNNLDYLQLLTLKEAVNTFHSAEYTLPNHILNKAKDLYPVQAQTERLERALGEGLRCSEYVVKNVVLPNGFVADVLMCLKGGSPIKLAVNRTAEKVPIEELDIQPGSITLCLLNFHPGCFSLNSNRLRGVFRLVLDILESQGYATLAINTQEWLNTPAHERTQYLLREVDYKCGEIGMKLGT